ncbi:MAG: hypothetical protein WCP01_05980 [Methylococcaceae bacterium]
MKTYPLHDTAYSLSGDHLHFNLLLAETGNLGIEVYSLGESKIHIEANRQPLPLQELKLALIGQDAQDFLIALRSLLTLIDEGTA